MAGRLVPFSVGHFERWAKRLILDNGVSWRLEGFQRDWLEDLFGGRRENWLIVPEGNGKTTMIAGLGLYGLRFADDAQIPIAASTRDQARIMYRQAKGFVKRSKIDAGRGRWFEAFDGYRRVDLRAPGVTRRGEVVGYMEVHAADSGSADGVIPYPFAFIDELHRHKSLELYETWRGKLEKRGAQIVTISTAGAPGSEFEEARDRIRTGGIVVRKTRTWLRSEAPGIVMHEHALDKREDVDDLELVAEANPFSGVTVDTLRRKRSSLTMTDSHWRRFTCNIAAQTDADLFIDERSWKSCGRGPAIPDDAVVCIGADGSRTWDTTVIAWATALDDHLDVDCHVFSVRRDIPHHTFHDAGRINMDDVEEFLVGLFDRYAPLETAYDPRYLERTMELVDVRLPSSAIVQVEPQSKHARDAYQALFTAVQDGRLRHRDDPVIASHLANCTVERDERNQEIRRLRKIDARKPIDAVPALALAVWRAVEARPSIYETQEVFAV